jgi:sec-independent protein translocase protein TatA
MPFNLGAPEFLIILVIVLIVFGAGKLPSVMRDFGKGVKEFKKAQDEEVSADTTTSHSTATGAPTTTTANGATGTTAATTTAATARTSENSPRA